MDIDSVLVLAHSSEKQDAAATWKKLFGRNPDGVRRPRTRRSR
nr:hypothetical protein [Streptomyces muensis]